ncbi:MAG: type II toxin-antitoxin system HigB family toxin [Bacteroidetes bacterium]|nr:type II toxin-antitoxin system HigB family toxin [Bacteroidota bacterium]
MVKKADWESVNDIKQAFGYADSFGKKSNRICYKVGGDNYR